MLPRRLLVCLHSHYPFPPTDPQPALPRHSPQTLTPTSSCIINPTTTTLAACCPLGSTCDSPCPADQFQCATTLTLSTTTTLLPACCPRRCPSPSQFGCPSSLGSGCCSYGSVCAPPSQCLSTLAPSTTSRPLVLPVPPGCTTSQIACAPSLGGGCCAVTQSCTLVAGAPHCADAAVTPTASGVARADDEGDGLTTGAKAGIGVGVVGFFAIVTAVLTVFCLRRRGRPRRRRRGEQGGGMTETEVISGSGPLEGVAQGYAGPEPGLGPYSEREEEYYAYTTSTTPVVGGAALGTPHGPGDILGAVELDSRGVESGERRGGAGLGAGEGGPSPMTEGGGSLGGTPGWTPGWTPEGTPYEGGPWAAEGRR